MAHIMKANPLPPVKFLRECFTYDPKTGMLTWKKRPCNHFPAAWEWKRWNTIHAETQAGNKTTRQIKINNRSYYPHRIIWKMVTGKEPTATIDHKDCNCTNNRWSNLRPATQRQQCWNTRLQKSNSSGYRGVHRHGPKWQAYITINGVRYCRGSFDTAEEAAAAYEIVARKVHGEFYRGATP